MLIEACIHPGKLYNNFSILFVSASSAVNGYHLYGIVLPCKNFFFLYVSYNSLLFQFSKGVLVPALQRQDFSLFPMNPIFQEGFNSKPVRSVYSVVTNVFQTRIHTHYPFPYKLFSMSTYRKRRYFNHWIHGTYGKCVDGRKGVEGCSLHVIQGGGTCLN